MSLKVSIETPKKGSVDLEVPSSATVGDVRRMFAKQRRMDVHRVSLRQGDARLDDDEKKLTDVATAPYNLTLKDLGPQIGYRTVFVLEYLGPILFVGGFAACRRGLFGPQAQTLLFGKDAAQPMNNVAELAVLCWVGHFLKRELETFFVHKFSRPTMPFSNLYKNCTYYWTFGAVIGYPLCSTAFRVASPAVVQAGLGLFLLSELGNFYCHVKLSNMRPAEGSKKREIPKGFMFDLVACPNYFFEIMSWVGFTVMTLNPAFTPTAAVLSNQTLWSAAFTLVGLLQMSDWALKKHKEYKKSFGKEYTDLRRKAMFPFIF